VQDLAYTVERGPAAIQRGVGHHCLTSREVPVNVQIRQEGNCFARSRMHMQENDEIQPVPFERSVCRANPREKKAPLKRDLLSLHQMTHQAATTQIIAGEILHRFTGHPGLERILLNDAF